VAVSCSVHAIGLSWGHFSSSVDSGQHTLFRHETLRKTLVLYSEYRQHFEKDNLCLFCFLSTRYKNLGSVESQVYMFSPQSIFEFDMEDIISQRRALLCKTKVTVSGDIYKPNVG